MNLDLTMTPKEDESRSETPWRLAELPLSSDQHLWLTRFYSSPTNAEQISPRDVRKFEDVSALAPLRVHQENWREEDRTLLDKALNNDGGAFLQLVARDARYLCSDLGLSFITRWQSTLDMEVLFPIGGRDQNARENLQRISSMLLKPFDRRGKREKSFPQGAIKNLYYAALILFAGIKNIGKRKKFKDRTATVEYMDRLREQIGAIQKDHIVADLCRSQEERGYSFLLVVQRVDSIIKTLASPDQFSSDQMFTTPSNQLAKLLAADYFHIKERTIDRAIASDAVMLWPLPDSSIMGFASKPPKNFLRLDRYPPVTQILRQK